MFVHMLNGGSVRGRAVVVGGNSGSGDGGFVDEPVVSTTVSGNTTISGKVKSGSFGKFVFPLATVQAGRQYTFRYTPHFAQLAQQGKLAMVGFGLKTDNDFHLVGLRGDGSTGLHKYKVYGTPPNGWNQQTGHTTVDGGASANGTQAGPNYIRLVSSADGTTYTFKTSPDGSTWTTEFSGAAPSPFSNVSGAATFGVALWFSNSDAGPFSIDIDQFADAAAPVEMVYSYEGAASDSSNLTTYTFNSKNVGAAGTGRVIALAVQTRTTSIGTPRAINSATCNGNAMSLGPRITGTNSGHCSIAWFYIVEPTGTTANFVVTFNNGTQNCAIGTYRLFPVSSTPVDTATINGGTPQTLTDLEVKTSGLALILVDSGRTASPQLDSYSWTGVDTPVHDLTDLINDQSGSLNLFSIATTENDTTRDFTAAASGDVVYIAGISFQ
ncbi:hypothetical protein EOD23_11555 [Mesorhizobium sp. USDA-HM6]|nr:hypothetical protein EOD23_11555 [Mesorhizobium sp. USDA-HM6]